MCLIQANLSLLTAKCLLHVEREPTEEIFRCAWRGPCLLLWLQLLLLHWLPRGEGWGL